MTNTDLITVAISTIGSRVENISLPDQTDGVCYLILIQSAEPNHVDFFDRRPDVVVVAIEGIGLSNSRNRAIQLTVGDLLLFADDDTSLDVLGIQALARVLRLDAELAVVAGWRAEKIPQCAKSKRLTKLNSGRVCAPEFMIRKSLFIQAGIQFDPDFGLGAPFGVGEDYIFIADALSRKLNCITVPVVTGSHPHQSTGDNWSSKELLQARKAVIRRVFGFWAPFVRVAYAIRHRAKFDAVSSIFSFVF